MRRRGLILIALALVAGGYAPLRAVDARGIAAGDITAARIVDGTESGIPSSTNGWVLELDIAGVNTGGTYDADFDLTGNRELTSGAKVILTVTSEGYSAAATPVLGTTTRTVYGTKQLRKVYPDQATSDELDLGTDVTIRIALSDFIYNDDTSITVDVEAGLYDGGTPNNAANDLAVTNNSTLDYSDIKAIGRWAWPPYEVVTGDFLLEAVVFHRFAKDGKPLAAVKFRCTDGTTENTATATVMTVSSRAGVGSAATNDVLVYAVTMSSAGWVDDSTVTCNFAAYPWVGDADSVLDSDTTFAVTEPDERLAPFKVLFDNDNDYVYGHAYVDATNGQASVAATWVYSAEATAESNYVSASTNSYNTIGRALAACDAYVDATHATRAEPGGCTIYLTGTSDWPGSTNGATLGTQVTWATITRRASVAKASAILNLVGTQGPNTERVKIYDISIFGNGATESLRMNSVTTNVLWIDHCTIDVTVVSQAFAATKVAYATRNTITALNGGFNSVSASRAPFALVRGNSGTAAVGPNGSTGISATFYTLLGNYNVRGLIMAPGNAFNPVHEESDNAIGAFNTHYVLGNGAASGIPWVVNNGNDNPLTHGNAYVQNVVERMENQTWATEVDEDDVAANNVIVWLNIQMGARMGMGYQDSGTLTQLKKNFSFRGNLFEEWANKDDTFPTESANRHGGWSVGYHVGAIGNVILESGGTEEWRGEFLGAHSVNTLSADLSFVDNAAFDAGAGGDDSGNGDYHPAVSNSGYALVPGAFIPLPYDLEGTARDVSGTGSAGAFEMSPAAGVGTRKSMMLMGVGEWFQEWWR
jgi:hypothetical protein